MKVRLGTQSAQVTLRAKALSRAMNERDVARPDAGRRDPYEQSELGKLGSVWYLDRNIIE